MDKEIKDKNGLTEKEFCEKYDQNKWPHPSLTADCVILTPSKVLLVRRGGHPSLGKLAFPGGFVEEGESAKEAAIRELKEETLSTAPPLRQLVTMTTPNRDPRCWIVTVCFYAFVDSPFNVQGGDDAASASWYDYEIKYNQNIATITISNGLKKEISKVEIIRDSFGNLDENKSISTGAMAFDHAKVLLIAYEKVNNKNGDI